jgi:ferredoxin-NADP reductase/MOSC domain-containing protein YiiM/ferredoxin
VEDDAVADAAAGQLVSVNVGLPRDVPWEGRIVHTGIWKEPVDGRRTVRRLNIDGDGQGDVGGHGGPNRAVFVYQLESYRYWEAFLGRDDFVPGQFGENFTVDGLADEQVRIGDRYRIGSALFEVSQPRVTCYRVGIRMNEPQIPALLVAHRRPGFYLRVLEEGDVTAGDDITLLERSADSMTVAEVDGLLYLPGHSRRDLERALRIPALSEGWRDSFRKLLERGPAEAPPVPAWPGLRPMRVVAIDRESTAVISVRLAPIDGQPVAAPQAGQFLTVRVQPGPGPTPLLRTYSLSGLPSDREYRISIKREALGTVSRYLHDQLHVGDVIEAGAPRGSFVLRPEQRPVALISAGVGATPVLAMLHLLVHERSGRPVWWLHGARNAAEHPFRSEVDALLGQLADAHRVVCYSDAGHDDVDYDIDGRLTADVITAAGMPTDADVYLCGPRAFMADITDALRSHGVPPEHISEEVFGPSDPITPGIAHQVLVAPHPPAGRTAAGPAVAFSRSNLSVRWDPSFANLLELAEACDVPVRWSCRTGVCHTCATDVVSGDVSYQPDPLELPPDGSALICCATPTGDIVLDL